MALEESPRTGGLLLAACLAVLPLAGCQTAGEADTFKSIDIDRDGRLTSSEVETYGFKRMFHRFDTDNDGAITVKDMDGTATNLISQRDLNRDGKVTYVEYETVGRRLGIVKKFFMSADTDGNGWISRKEEKDYLAAGGGPL
jgi:Ca2+-binding EF-hand superfamily protein